MTQNILDELKDLIFDSPLNIWIIANVSGPDPVTYQTTRPSQKANTFFKIIKHLKYNTELLRRYHKAASITLMCVVNNKNYKTLPEFVALAKDLGVFNLWFKPMEPHGEVTLPLLLNDDEKKDLKIYKAKADWAAKKLGVEFLTKENEGEETQEISQEELSQFPLLSFHLKNNFHDLASKDEFIRQRFTQEKFSKKTDTVLKPTAKGDRQCFIAYDYLRLTAQNEVLPCCAFDYTLGKIEDEILFSFWLSDPYQELREKLINPQFGFCKFCPHKHINNKLKSLRS
jgi:MoaA/NifB/PqqE/SkfB family radical SAM enzyme